MDRIVISLAVAILLGIVVTASTLYGEKIKQKEIINRALMIKEKDCYTETELEIIIFGEPQL